MEEWQEFLEKLQQSNNSLYDLYKDSELKIGTNLTIYFADENSITKAKSKRKSLEKKFPQKWKNKRVYLKVGTLTGLGMPSVQVTNISLTPKVKSPLQTLNNEPVCNNNDCLKSILEEVVGADQTCEVLYQQLTEKTKRLADETLIVDFLWRVRVGGVRGFQELLLPVFHPVYGIPYIPSSSLKGVVRAWARKTKKPKAEINRLLGTLDDGVACVQILDAFPTQPCLSVDIANPQWYWQSDNQVHYKPKPHFLLSMEKPNLAIGLALTSRSQDKKDVQTVKDWLQEALGTGIGSRVSSGYGRTQLSSGLPCSSHHSFKMWTQGMYGASTNQPEFRPAALRGMLRYWFRAFALGIYDPNTCQNLENYLFGNLSQEGAIRIGVEWTDNSDNSEPPVYCYEGKILLEAEYSDQLRLIKNLLYFASHVGGVGRGSRRPLHWNNKRMRGCYWVLPDFILPFDKQAWQDFIEDIQDGFVSVRRIQGKPGDGDPGDANERYQDVFNTNTKICLIPSPKLKHPRKVSNWNKDGYKPDVCGPGLEVLYSNPKFKGGSNPLVGGKFGIPSFVWIQSNFPSQGQAYQIVTVFGIDCSDRQAFVDALPANKICISASRQV